MGLVRSLLDLGSWFQQVLTPERAGLSQSYPQGWPASALDRQTALPGPASSQRC